MNPNDTNSINPASYTEELDWFQAVLNNDLLSSLLSDVFYNTELLEPISIAVEEKPQEQLQHQTVQPTLEQKESKKRKREEKKNEFFEEVLSAMSRNIESNPEFKPRKCTKYSPKQTPYEHLKHTFSLE